MRPVSKRPTVITQVLFACLAIFLLVFLILPVGKMLLSGLTDNEGKLAFDHIRLFFATPLYVESLTNSVSVALGASALAAILAFPLAMLLWRYRIQPPLFVELCGFLPLFIPPFMLSLSLQSFLGRGGALGFLLQSFADIDPSLWGLPGLAFIEAAHYFPLVLMTLIMTTSRYSQQANEAARLGCSWFRLTTRVFLPLGWPGLAFGMTITFLKTLDDLATPLSLGITNLLAPQAYFRVSMFGSQDPLSSLMAITIIVISGLAWLLSANRAWHHFSGQSAAFPTQFLPSSGIAQRQARIGKTCFFGILIFYAICYFGMFLASLAKIWSHSFLPESYVLTHYLTALHAGSGSFINTLIYCGLAAILDVIIGLIMAHAIDHASPRWKRTLNWGAASLLSVPGVALAIAYLQFFQGMQLPIINRPLDATWFLLPMAFSVRGLPFAIRACSFALKSVPDSCVEAASLSGASRSKTALRIVLPMMSFGLLAAFLICFGIAAVDLSSAMLLVPSETNAPVSYSIYLNMQTSTGRGIGSALAFLTIGFVALSMLVFAILMRRNRKTASSFRKIVLMESHPK